MGTLNRAVVTAKNLFKQIASFITNIFRKNKGASQPQTYHKIEGSTGMRQNRLLTGYAFNPQAIFIPYGGHRRKLKGYQKQGLRSFNSTK